MLEGQIYEKGETMKQAIFTPIPNELLFNKDILSKTKYVYLKIKQNSKDNSAIIRVSKIKSLCNISDNRTIVSALLELKKHEFINFISFNTVPKGEIVITFNECNPYTKIDNEIFEKIEQIFIPSHNAILLYYTLESYYNHNYGYACPSRHELISSLKISNEKLTSIVKIMHDNYICEFCQGEKVESDNTFLNIRTRNRYIPNTIKYSKDGITKNHKQERRYTKHKRKDFFFKNSDEPKS